ncbi:MAG TPA: TetR/AcrR family transcriptional regulator [Mycobacteriales bacterium]
MTTTQVRRSSAETRAHVLAVAGELFYTDGIRATGIDRVAAAAGVAPTTLYRLFASKDDLIAAYLEDGREHYLAWLDRGLSAAGTPAERLLAAFDEQAAAAASEGFRGCPFLMALAEFPDPAHPAHATAVRTKAEVRDRLRAVAAELPDPDGLTDRLLLVMEGVYATIQAFGPDGPAVQARAVAELILSAVPRRRGRRPAR